MAGGCIAGTLRRRRHGLVSAAGDGESSTKVRHSLLTHIKRCMGSYDGSMTADVEYPMAFQEGMAQVLEAKPARPRFRYVHLSGKFVIQDQEAKLWYLEKPRKIRVGPKPS